MNQVTICFFHGQPARLVETYADYILRRVEYKWDIQLLTVVNPIQNTLRFELDTNEYEHASDKETLSNISHFIDGIHTCLKTIESNVTQMLIAKALGPANFWTEKFNSH